VEKKYLLSLLLKGEIISLNGHGIQNVKTYYRTAPKKDEKHGPHQKSGGLIQVLAKDKQLLLLIRLPP
jgi:hypothetical protein